METRIVELDYEDFSIEKAKPFPAVKETLYSKYVAERLDAKITENEHGFIVWNHLRTDIFIVDFFVKEESRRQGRGRELLNMLYRTAQETDSTQIIANIFLSDKNANQTLLGALVCGFKVTLTSNNCITISKEVG